MAVPVVSWPRTAATSLANCSGRPHALVEGDEAGERLGAGGLRSEDGDEAVGGISDGAAKGELDLGVHPVHDAAAADVDGKGSGAALDHLLELGLPRLARAQIVLVEPDAQAVFARLGGRLEALLERAGGFGIDPGMAQKKQRRLRSVGIRH